ncbi:MAG: hypothetical protein IJX39_02415 [Clostridia bacterium]|nr:hypothetical protein [Clostridia bacterium]
MDFLPPWLFAQGLVLLATVAIVALLIAAFSDFLGDFADGAFVYIVKLFMVIFCVAGCCLPFAVSVLSALDMMIEYRKIRQGRYIVVDDVLSASSSSEVYPPSLWERLQGMGGSRYETPHYATFYFSRSGRHPVSERMYENGKKGDRYYILILDGKKQKIYGIYSQKLYRWEGEPVPIKAKE